jgi:DNA-binding MarR family transcriptional regulator
MKRPPAQGRRLSEHIPFLLARLASQLAIEANSDFRALGVNTLSSRVLFVLLTEQIATVGELSTITSIDQSTLSHILIRLGRKGLVTKHKKSRDSRVVDVRLTVAGRKVAQRCFDIGIRFDEVITATLDARQKADLRRLLQKLYRNLTASEGTQNGDVIAR